MRKYGMLCQLVLQNFGIYFFGYTEIRSQKLSAPFDHCPIVSIFAYIVFELLYFTTFYYDN